MAFRVWFFDAFWCSQGLSGRSKKEVKMLRKIGVFFEGVLGLPLGCFLGVTLGSKSD